MTRNLICTIEGCENKTNGRMVCDPHRARFRRKGHYDYEIPRPKLPNGHVKFCIKHGFLLPDQTRLDGKTIKCFECLKVSKKSTREKLPDFIGIERECTCCKEIKQLNEFSPYHQKYKWPRCRKCNFESHKRLYAKHKYHFKKKYNLSVEQYNDILRSQNNRCFICNRTADEAQPGKKNRIENNLSVDHCHKLEKQGMMAIRGLLCFSCNAVLGKFNDDINLFKKAIEYLERDPVLITRN